LHKDRFLKKDYAACLKILRLLIDTSTAFRHSVSARRTRRPLRYGQQMFTCRLVPGHAGIIWIH